MAAKEILPIFPVVWLFPAGHSVTIFALSKNDMIMKTQKDLNPGAATLRRRITATLKTTFLAAAVLLGLPVAAQRSDDTQKTKNMKAIELTTAEFKTQIFDFSANETWKYNGDLPAVIDFYATWCGPCKMMSPVMETLAGEYEGRVRVYKVDVDKEKRLAALFKIRSIPTFIFIPMNGEPQHANGAMGIEEMRKIIDGTLLGKKQ